MNKFRIILAALAAALVVFYPALVLAAGPLYITAVQTSGGTGHTTDDFVELFNPGADPVSLKDFKLVKRTAQGIADTVLKSWNEDVMVAGYGFYLWANSGYAGIGASPDATTSGSIADDNGVALRYGAADTGEIADALAWDGAVNGFPVVSGNVAAGSVLRRQELYSAQSGYEILSATEMTPRNSNISLPPEPDPAPAEDQPPVVVEPPANDPPLEVQPPSPVDAQPPIIVEPPVYLDIQITEVLPNPSGDDAGHEAVEIYNPNNEEVDLAGWYLGDDGSTLAPASNALALSGLISPNSYKTVVIPAGKFTLNNTGGDSVHLFSPDLKPMDSIAYTGTAGENQSFQRFADGWVWASETLGSENVKPTSADDNSEPTTSTEETVKKSYSGINLSEFYPAYGLENSTVLAEVFNKNNSATDMKGWKLEIASTHLKKPTSAALIIDNSNVAPAGGWSTIALTNVRPADFEPSEKFWLMLFSPDGKEQDAVNIKGIVNHLSYAKVGAVGWEWTEWSPAAENPTLNFDQTALQFTEVLPAYPDRADESFVELKNIGSAPVYLGNLQIKIGSKSVWLPDSELSPGEYYAVMGDDLPAALATAGKKIFLADANDRTVLTAEYPKAKEGLSYALLANGRWSWTQQATPSAENIWDPPVAGSSKKTATKTAAKTPIKTASTKIASATTKPVAKAVATEAIANPAPKKQSKKPAWVFGLIGAGLLAAAVVVWFVSREEEEDLPPRAEIPT